MHTICHQVGIKAELDVVHKALTTAESLSNWWSSTNGNLEAGEEFCVTFGDSRITLMVLQQNPTKIAWQCMEVHPEWVDTQIIFELEEKDQQTFVHFRHEMWSEDTPLFAHCSTKWAVYLLSLKNLIESGSGQPYPNDINVNHNEGN